MPTPNNHTPFRIAETLRFLALGLGAAAILMKFSWGLYQVMAAHMHAALAITIAAVVGVVAFGLLYSLTHPSPKQKKLKRAVNIAGLAILMSIAMFVMSPFTLYHLTVPVVTTWPAIIIAALAYTLVAAMAYKVISPYATRYAVRNAKLGAIEGAAGGDGKSARSLMGRPAVPARHGDETANLALTTASSQRPSSQQ